MEQSDRPSRTFLLAAFVALVWLAATYFFWTGFVGAADDKSYTRYAFLFHRPPISWWEFRIPYILALRSSFALFGPSEFAAALPNLIASVIIAIAVAWFAGWSRKPSWQAVGAALLAVTIPIDVGFRSTALAPFFAGGLLIAGAVCFLRGSRAVQVLGAALLAAGYATHEVAFFFVAILCVTSLVVDRKRYWRPVLLCVVFSGAVVLTEAIVYKHLLGDPLARFRTSSGSLGHDDPVADPTSDVRGAGFFTWPLENLIFSKNFAFDLGLLLISGVLVWRRLCEYQKILFIATFLTWAYLGYGTLEPWKYQPLYRQMHYYIVLILGMCALLPWTLTLLVRGRERLAQAIVVGIIFVHLACNAAGGHWGQNVGVSRALLSFVKEHPAQTFLADKNSMDEMYMLNRFKFPPNVICLNGPEVDRYLIVNQEPPSTPRFRFPELPVQGILINREAEVEPGFTRFEARHPGNDQIVMPISFKLIFEPLLLFLHPREFMIKSRGGSVIWLPQPDLASVKWNEGRPAL